MIGQSVKSMLIMPSVLQIALRSCFQVDFYVSGLHSRLFFFFFLYVSTIQAEEQDPLWKETEAFLFAFAFCEHKGVYGPPGLGT